MYIKIRSHDKTKFELEVNDNQSANKFTIERSSHQIFGLLQRITDILTEEEKKDIQELKKILLG